MKDVKKISSFNRDDKQNSYERLFLKKTEVLAYFSPVQYYME